MFPVGRQQQLVRCQQCGLGYVTPWKEEQSFYEEDYFVAKNQYLSRSKEFDPIFASILTKIHRFKPTGKLLDVGCGPGLFLAKARDVGYEVAGIELSNWAANFAKTELQLMVIPGEVEITHFPPRAFDVIVANHVFEHLPNPVQTLQILSTWLKDDGILVVGVPNFGSIMAQLKKEKWSSLLPEQHRWHFTPKTLTNMLIQHGFEKVHISFYNHRYRGSLGRTVLISFLHLIAIVWSRGEAMLVIARKSI
jgi:2-polyprenyl-3-methyl-5-hydroxy-6-metoxy-1,4-benzoquinol methylase